MLEFLTLALREDFGGRFESRRDGFIIERFATMLVWAGDERKVANSDTLEMPELPVLQGVVS